MTDLASAAPSTRTPQPGDGAYLAQSQPGQGGYLQNTHNAHPRGDLSARGRGEVRRGGPSRGRGRGARPNGVSQTRDGEQLPQDQSRPSDQANGHQDGYRRPQNQHRNAPRRPAQPRGFDNVVPDSSPSTAGQGGAEVERGVGETGGSARGRNPRTRTPKRKGQNAARDDKGGDAVAEVTTALDGMTTKVRTGQLDPGASTFVPSASSSAPLSRVTSRHSNGPPSQAGDAKPKKGKKRGPKPDRQPEQAGQNGQAAGTDPATAAAGARSSRRAAFESQTKLTTTHNDDGEISGQGRTTAKGQANGEGKEKGKGGNNGRTIKEDKDDLVSRLTRGLKSRPYLECPICFNSITPHQPIWSCLPPTDPPVPPKNPALDEPPPDLVKHYSACYTPFHLSCIRDWANRSLVEERERARGYGKDEDDVSWRCPGCQKRRADSVGGYKCFCGRVASPSAGHGCGEGCGRKRSGCEHACPLTCHPGPCPPCQVALVVPCPSHHTGLTVKCAVASSNNAALTPVCDEICGKERNCGNVDHACEQLCHFGPCSTCTALETVRCYCGGDTKEVACGWNRKEEKRCSSLNADGEEESWVGRYCCGRSCAGVYDCGVHPCEQLCHPHPIKPLVCPLDPSQITHCACGTTPLSLLSTPPRTKCLDPIPTCDSRCPKSRPCGHQCTRNCHTGECPPCHEEVIRHCRCGESVLVVPCDEMRAKKESGEDVTCERVCKALRNCGRHECGRVCCPLAYKAKNRKSKRAEEERHEGADDLHECHLTCGRMLGCGLHTCTRPDHKGACGRCLQASYDELICHCGHTVVYPPVPCGATISCLYPCARPPPSCGHPRTPHTCHENAQCPPCPFLTTKPCLCGKDPAVKNVRCSQEKVSCGQTCGKLLVCGYHRCQKLCHAPESTDADGHHEGGCEDCKQTCGKAKRVCGHPCTAACHAPAKCLENDPCQAIVTVSCPCGHLQQRSNCGASAGPSGTGANGSDVKQGREKVGLKCNSECAVRARNARLADALGIPGGTGRTGNEVEWPEELLAFARANNGFVKVVEGTLDTFVKGTRTSQILPYMPPAKRTFVMSLADIYRLGKELVDQEPNRSVMIRRKGESRIPTPLLSAVSAPSASAAKLGGLANLRAPTPSTPGGSSAASWRGAAPVASVPARGWAASNGGSLAGVVSGSAGNSRTATPVNGTATPTTAAPAPVAPLAGINGAVAASSTLTHANATGQPSGSAAAQKAVKPEREEKVLGEVGKVDEADWDVSDEE